MAAIDQLRTAFADGLGLDPASVDWSSLAYREVVEWDSVAHMALVAEIEDRFGVMLDVDDVIAMSTFDVAQVILTRYGVDFT